jgi:hypothetical protein
MANESSEFPALGFLFVIGTHTIFQSPKITNLGALKNHDAIFLKLGYFS